MATITITLEEQGLDCLVTAVADPCGFLPERRVRLRNCALRDAIARFARFAVPRHATILVDGVAYPAKAY